MAADCVFCKIGAGQLPSDMLLRNDHVFVIRDINPIAPTHLLVIPVKHVVTLNELTPEDGPMSEAMFTAARDAARLDGVDASGYRLVINQGEDGGQEVPHLHMHVLGGKRLRGVGLR